MKAVNPENLITRTLQFIIDSEARYEQIQGYGKLATGMHIIGGPRPFTDPYSVVDLRAADTMLVNCVLSDLGGIPATITGNHPDIHLTLTEWQGPVPDDSLKHLWIGHTTLAELTQNADGFGQIAVSPNELLADFLASKGVDS